MDIDQRDLLEHLASLTHCVYLSDLRQPALRTALVQAVTQTPATDFPASQWRETLQYLSHCPSPDADSEQLRALLLRHLSS